MDCVGFFVSLKNLGFFEAMFQPARPRRRAC